jgi:hypothetical protein
MAWAARQSLGDRNFLALQLRDQLDASGHPGPHIVASGPPITIRAGHCQFLGGVANGVPELRAAIRERRRSSRDRAHRLPYAFYLLPSAPVTDHPASVRSLPARACSRCLAMPSSCRGYFPHLVAGDRGDGGAILVGVRPRHPMSQVRGLSSARLGVMMSPASIKTRHTGQEGTTRGARGRGAARGGRGR